MHRRNDSMTATQVFFLFLKDECLINEMRFFKWVILKEHGNKFFNKRGLFTPTFVEDYLSRNNRTLSNFMTRLFILAPNLIKLNRDNPRLNIIKEDYNTRNEGKSLLRRGKRYEFGDDNGRIRLVEHKYRIPCKFNPLRNGMYVNYYVRKWNKFLRENIESDKKINSPFKKGECYDFKLKNK